MRSLSSFALSILLISTTWCLTANPAWAAVDLSPFPSKQYCPGCGQPGNGNWVLSANNTAVTQTVNNNPSMYLNQSVEATLNPNVVSNVTVDFDVYINSTDDDAWGFAWGWQNVGDWYGFSWTNNNSTANVFMVNDGSGDPFIDPTNSTIFDSATGTWPYNTVMHFHLDYSPPDSIVEVTVDGNPNPIQTFSFTDSTFTSGKFGFWTFSQGGVTFSNLPEPSIGATTLCGALLLLHLRHRSARSGRIPLRESRRDK